MSRTHAAKHSIVGSVAGQPRGSMGDHRLAIRGRCGRGDVVSPAGHAAGRSVTPAAAAGAGRVPACGCIVGTHAELSRPALRVASRVLSDQDLTAPHAGAGSRLVSHTIRPEQRGKEDTMNRWTGTGHLTKDTEVPGDR
jgi:hypothetical protein